MSRIQDEIAGRKIDEIIFKRPAAGGIIFILLKFLDQTAPCSGEMIATITTEDLKGFCERVEQGGGKVLQQPEFREEFQLWFAIAADPEGHLIEAVEFAGAAPV
jgi:predicted enzyme related to lactoylglutathione lyase